MTAIIVFLFGLFLGACVGFLLVGVFTLESSNEDVEELQRVIKSQRETIDKQAEVIRGFRERMCWMEDDGK